MKYLSDLSNTGETGSWLFFVGAHNRDEIGIKEPDQLSSVGGTSTAEPTTCADGGRLRCHSSALCEDGLSGFCCLCRDGYYGNGLNCIKSDAPIRAAGKVTGNVNNVEINGQLQSYILLNDGRSYTALSSISKEIGFGAQLGAAALGNGIGWLFAKAGGSDGVPNGYQVCPNSRDKRMWIVFI